MDILKIDEIAKKLGIKDIIPYGNYKAKINYSGDLKGKLIIVSAINPTPFGEGKTTVSISLCDALNSLSKSCILSLREPSLGPVFGFKGGAIGGGMSKIVPEEDINLHFTGDFHAITTANNLLSAVIDNHIYFGNSLGFDKVLHKRCIDINDRQLRCVKTNLREDNFQITAASEIMSIMALSKDLDDLKERLGNITVGLTKDKKLIKAKELNITGAMASLLKDALLPNLVQTKYQNPAIVHTGPFANISLGCSSIKATNTSLSLSDYVIEEAGFGADLGLEKFIDIKCRLGLNPYGVVLVATIRSLKYHGLLPIDEINEVSLDCLDKGLNNLYKHIDTIKNVYNLDVVVAINKFDTDNDIEIEYLKNKLDENNIKYSLVTSFNDGVIGAVDLANKVINFNYNEFNYAYDLTDSIKDKIYKVATKVYKASEVIYKKEALEKINNLDLEFKNYPICISKTQYSLSSDKDNLLCASPYNIEVTDIIVNSGAKFIVVMTNNVITLPGLSKNSNYENIDVIDNKIIGI